MTDLLIAVIVGAALLVVAAGFVSFRLRRRRQHQIDRPARKPLRADSVDEEFWTRRRRDRTRRPPRQRSAGRGRVTA